MSAKRIKSHPRFPIMWSGGRGTPAHTYEDCPHLGRRAMSLGGLVYVPYYSLTENANVLGLIDCHWCRSRYLDETINPQQEVTCEADFSLDDDGE